jgi:hypothetical protein
MFISALFSFLGGTAFRMIWGEVSSWLTKAQDHKFEIDRLALQEQVDAKTHERNLESLRLQSDLGIKEITVQADNAIRQLDVEAFLKGVDATTKKSGVRWIDGWNAVIRPAVATWAILMITASEFALITSMSENSWMVASAALGIYLADRTLFKRGK